MTFCTTVLVPCLRWYQWWHFLANKTISNARNKSVAFNLWLQSLIDSKRVDCYFTLVLTPWVSEKYIYSFNNSFLEAESKTVTAAPQWSDTITKINLPKYKHKRINTNTGGEIQTQKTKYKHKRANTNTREGYKYNDEIQTDILSQYFFWETAGQILLQHWRPKLQKCTGCLWKKCVFRNLHLITAQCVQKWFHPKK